MAAQVGDLVVCGGEVVFQPDDPGGRGQAVAFVEQGADADGELELAATIAAMPAVGTLGTQEVGGVQAAQERLLDADQVRGLAGGERRIVMIVEVVKMVHSHGRGAPPSVPDRRVDRHLQIILSSCLTQSTVSAIRNVSVRNLVTVPLGVIEMNGASVPRTAGAGLGQLPETDKRGFAELVCADPEWVRAEFDAIIAANFGAAEQPETPRRRPPRPARGHRDRSDHAGRRFGPPARAERGDLTGTARRVGARERSPPPTRREF